MEPVDFIVEGLLAPGLYILGGSPKVGKSWLALQLCLAVCDGTSFLGRATHRSEVLYLALEGRSDLRAGTAFPVPPKSRAPAGRSGNWLGSEPHQQQKIPAALAR